MNACEALAAENSLLSWAVFFALVIIILLLAVVADLAYARR